MLECIWTYLKYSVSSEQFVFEQATWRLSVPCLATNWTATSSTGFGTMSLVTGPSLLDWLQWKFTGTSRFSVGKTVVSCGFFPPIQWLPAMCLRRGYPVATTPQDFLHVCSSMAACKRTQRTSWTGAFRKDSLLSGGCLDHIKMGAQMLRWLIIAILVLDAYEHRMLHDFVQKCRHPQTAI